MLNTQGLGLAPGLPYHVVSRFAFSYFSMQVTEALEGHPVNFMMKDLPQGILSSDCLFVYTHTSELKLCCFSASNMIGIPQRHEQLFP